MRLRPFFSFYGSKYKMSRHYPGPQNQIIVEPFAGSAGYATNYHDCRVILYEIDPNIWSVWDYLIRAKQSEIRRLPIVTNLDDLPSCIPLGARNLIGFWMCRCGAAPKRRLTLWGRTGRQPMCFWSTETRDRIASQVGYIRHWKVYNRSYDQAPNRTATWFIDPPYNSAAGKWYRSGKPDYEFLASWILERFGQVIVCEHNGADWMPFRPLYSISGCKAQGKTKQRSEEGMYTSSNYRIRV